MFWWQAVILGIVEGVTEFLPISSTGHMVLVSDLLKIPQNELVKSFEIIIQLGAIGAILVLYWRKLLVERETMKRVLVAFVPTGILGFVLYKVVKHFLLGNVWVTVLALGIGGLALILLDSRKRIDKENYGSGSEGGLKKLGYGKAVVIGLAQAVSMIPGVSRAAATIVGGMEVGLSREQATEFSFLLAVPTMLAATGLDLVKSGMSIKGNEWGLIALGFGVAFVTAMGVVSWLIRFVKKHSLRGFGVYRIVLAVIYAIIFFR